MTVTKAQHRALKWLAEQGGHANLDQWGRATVPSGDVSKIAPQTWLRLFISGHIARSFLPDHFGITMEGVNAAGRLS